MTKLKKVMLKKNSGNITSLLIGQMLMLVLIIYCLFNFRLTMLNAVFNYIDDSLTTSLLGGALVNVEEYGKSNQLVIHNNDRYEKTNTGDKADTQGWEEWEAAILLSELNYGSDITLTFKELEPKEVLSISNRDDYTYNLSKNDSGLGDGSVQNMKDYYMRRCFSAFMGNLSYNTSNGLYTSTYNVNNLAPDISGIGALYTGGGNNSLVIDDSVLAKSILGNFLVGDIEITRFDIYNVYRGNLAEKHVYKSEYMTYNGAPAPINEAVDSITSSSDIKWKDTEPSTEDEFDYKYKPLKYTVSNEVKTKRETEFKGKTKADFEALEADAKLTGELNEEYATELAKFEMKKARWQTDLEYFESGDPLICYTNTQTTYQGKYKESKVPFKYFFSEGNNFDITATDNADKVTADKKAPIVGYSVYSYKSANSDYSYTPGSTMGYKDHIASTVSDITIQGGKMDGTKIENTALYVEITFTVETFPSFVTLSELDTTGKQTVTIARLIDIELNED